MTWHCVRKIFPTKFFRLNFFASILAPVYEIFFRTKFFRVIEVWNFWNFYWGISLDKAEKSQRPEEYSGTFSSFFANLKATINLCLSRRISLVYLVSEVVSPRSIAIVRRKPSPGDLENLLIYLEFLFWYFYVLLKPDLGRYLMGYEHGRSQDSFRRGDDSFRKFSNFQIANFSRKLRNM